MDTEMGPFTLGKSAGLQSYLSTFCNRGKTVRHDRCKGIGKGSNSMNNRKRTVSGGCEQLQSNKEVEINNIIDIHPEPYHRTNTVCLKYTGTNTQNHQQRNSVPTVRMDSYKPKEIRFVDIPQIHKNLWIGDINSIQYWMDTFKHHETAVIINVSDIQITLSRYDGNPYRNVVLHHIPFQDSRLVLFNDFYRSFLTLRDLLEGILSDDGKKVIIVCNAGVNRSAAMAVAYAISIGLKCNDMIEYVADRKFEVSPNWDNITNTRFRTILRQLQSRTWPTTGLI
jgi:hypothetical protein